MQKKHKIIVMVGLPASGKSTYINDRLNGHSANYIISDDDITNEVANEVGFTYNEMFYEPEAHMDDGHIHPKYGEVITIDLETKKRLKIKGQKCYKRLYHTKEEEYRRLQNRFKESLQQHKPIIIDMPNLTIESRETIIDEILKYKDQHQIVTVEHVEFKYGDITLLQNIAELRRLKVEKEGGTKTIPKEVYEYMDSIYTPVCTSEKHVNNIIIVDNEKPLTRILMKEEHMKARRARGYYLRNNKGYKRTSNLKRV